MGSSLEGAPLERDTLRGGAPHDGCDPEGVQGAAWRAGDHLPACISLLAGWSPPTEVALAELASHVTPPNSMAPSILHPCLTTGGAGGALMRNHHGSQVRLPWAPIIMCGS